MTNDDKVPEGMMEIFTVECDTDVGLLIDALRETAEEAIQECERRGPGWRSKRLVVPYGDR